MSESVDKNIVGENTPVLTEDGHPMLHSDYPSIMDSLKRALERYRRDKVDYFNTLGDDEGLIKKMKRWQRSARDVISWAGTLFNANVNDQEYRDTAMEILDKVTKEAQIQLKNAEQLTDSAVEAAEEKDKESVRDKMENAEYSASAFARRAIETQRRYMDHYLKGDSFASRQHQREVEVSARAAEFREKVLPRDRIYLPGQVIPPFPVPMTERVPERPDPYILFKNQPVDAYEFDREINEIVLKKGYVSEDGLIDDESVKYDLENGTCTMKYRGGEPVTWAFWKAKDTYDVIQPGSWVAEYLRRSYLQKLEDEAPGILKRKPYEDEIPAYNVKPAIRE